MKCIFTCVSFRQPQPLSFSFICPFLVFPPMGLFPFSLIHPFPLSLKDLFPFSPNRLIPHPPNMPIPLCIGPSEKIFTMCTQFYHHITAMLLWVSLGQNFIENKLCLMFAISRIGLPDVYYIYALSFLFF